MQLGRFKNRTPARFEYIYCTLFPLCHSNYDMYPFLKDASVCPFFCFVLEAIRGTIFKPVELHALWIISIYIGSTYAI